MKKYVMTSGITFPVHAMRVTEVIGATPRDKAILGDSLVRKRLSVTITPVIEQGFSWRNPTGPIRESYRGPDKFNHFEFQIRHRGWRRWIPIPDRELQGMLDRHCAVEFWTSNTPTNPDPDHPWIHWFFPSTSWLRGRRGWTGRSHGDAPAIVPEDIPDVEPLSNGGFWKTAMSPPN